MICLGIILSWIENCMVSKKGTMIKLLSYYIRPPLKKKEMTPDIYIHLKHTIKYNNKFHQNIKTS